MSDPRPKTNTAQAAHAERSSGGAREVVSNFPDIKIKRDIKSKTKMKIAEIVEQYPEEALNLIRRWLHSKNH